ncbi:MAG: TIR domain-containing protein [Vulcanimicrobiaceae bacterium]|jgi:hypothetical protein
MTPREDGAWIFVSHSTKDVERTRLLRNKLEALGHHPLLFFLKCLDDNAEVDDLIKREIASREWFLLCDSENARASGWVQREIEIIKNLPGKVFESVDLDADLDTQLLQATKLTRRASVFISFTREDSVIAHEIAAIFRAHDYGVATSEDVAASSPRGPLDFLHRPRAGDMIRKRIEDAADRGWIVFLVSEHTLRSKASRIEIAYACRRALKSQRTAAMLRNEGRYNVYPIVVGERFSQEQWRTSPILRVLVDVQSANLNEYPSVASFMELLISDLKTREMH